MTITTQRTTANSPAQAAKNRVRGPTVAARRRGAVDAARFAASHLSYSHLSSKDHGRAEGIIRPQKLLPRNSIAFTHIHKAAH